MIFQSVWGSWRLVASISALRASPCPHENGKANIIWTGRPSPPKTLVAAACSFGDSYHTHLWVEQLSFWISLGWKLRHCFIRTRLSIKRIFEKRCHCRLDAICVMINNHQTVFQVFRIPKLQLTVDWSDRKSTSIPFFSHTSRTTSGIFVPACHFLWN